MTSKVFLEWEKNKTFPFSFSLPCVDHFRQETMEYNRLSAELLCVDIEHKLNYLEDYFHITLESEEQIATFEAVHYEWLWWRNKRTAVFISFRDMFLGSGLTNKIIDKV